MPQSNGLIVFCFVCVFILSMCAAFVSLFYSLPIFGDVLIFLLSVCVSHLVCSDFIILSLAYPNGCSLTSVVVEIRQRDFNRLIVFVEFCIFSDVCVRLLSDIMKRKMTNQFFT